MKRFVAVVVAALFLTTPAYAETNADVSGFLDVYYTISDSPADVAADKNPNEKKFLVEGEVDITAALGSVLDVEIDFDLYVNAFGNNSTINDSAEIEQAFFVLKDTLGPFTAIGGVFNNPIGFEAEDAPDLYQLSHGQIYSILDDSTALHGNNVAGLALQWNMGPAGLTVAMIDDLARTDEESSALAVLNYTLSEGIDIEIGYVSQADETDSAAKTTTDLGKALNDPAVAAAKTTAGDIIDVNITFKTWTHFIFAMEYLSADEVIDHAYGVTANLGFGEKVSLTVRYDVVSYDDSLFSVNKEDSKTSTLAISYNIAENLSAILEYKSITDNDGVGKAVGIVDGDGSQSILEFTAKF